MSQDDKPSTLTRLAQGAAIGAALATIGGFWLGGWTLGGTAQKMADAARVDGQVSALAPICAAQFAKLEDGLAKFKSSDSWKHRSLVSDMVKKVGATDMNDDIAQACANLIDDAVKSTEKKS